MALEDLLDRVVAPADAPAPAILDTRGRVVATRGALGARVRSYAGAFAHAGLEAGDPVAFGVRQDADGIAWLLGALRAGIVVVVLDPGVAPSLVAAQCRAAGVRAVVTDGGVATLAGSRVLRSIAARRGVRLPDPATLAPARWATSRVIGIGGPPRLDRLAGDDARRPLPGDAAALVLFTSGTTGAPRGVVHSPAGLATTLEQASALVELGPGDRVLGTGLHLIGPALLAGAAVVLPPGRGASDALARTTRRSRRHARLPAAPPCDGMGGRRWRGREAPGAPPWQRPGPERGPRPARREPAGRPGGLDLRDDRAPAGRARRRGGAPGVRRARRRPRRDAAPRRPAADRRARRAPRGRPGARPRVPRRAAARRGAAHRGPGTLDARAAGPPRPPQGDAHPGWGEHLSVAVRARPRGAARLEAVVMVGVERPDGDEVVVLFAVPRRATTRRGAPPARGGCASARRRSTPSPPGSVLAIGSCRGPAGRTSRIGRRRRDRRCATRNRRRRDADRRHGGTGFVGGAIAGRLPARATRSSARSRRGAADLERRLRGGISPRLTRRRPRS